MVASLGSFVFSCAEAKDPGVDIPFTAVPEKIPHLVVDAPVRAFISELEEFVVDGHVENWKPDHDIFVNNKRIETTIDGHFTTVVQANPGLNFIHTRLESNDELIQDDKRSILSAIEQSLDKNLDHAVFLNLGEDIFDHIGALASDIVMSYNFSEEYGGQLISGEGGCSNSVWFRNFTLEDIDIDFDFKPGQLVMTMKISQPIFYIRARYARDSIFGCIRSTKNATLSNSDINVQATYALGTDEEGSPFLTVESSEASLEGFDLDVSGYPDFFIDWLAGDVAGDLETEIEESIIEQSEEALEGALSDLVPDAFKTEIGQDKLISTPFLNHFGASAHGLELALGISSTLETETPINYWSIYREDTEEPLSAHPNDLALGISYEFLNQFLALAWQNGELDQRIPVQGIPEDLNLDNKELNEANFELNLQPVIRHDEESGGTIFEFGEAVLTVSSVEGEVIFETILGLRASIGFIRNPTTDFLQIKKFDFTSNTTINVNNNPDINEFFVDALIEYELDTVLAKANKAIRTMEIEGARYSESENDDGNFAFRSSQSHLWFQIDPRVLFPLQ